MSSGGAISRKRRRMNQVTKHFPAAPVQRVVGLRRSCQRASSSDGAPRSRPSTSEISLPAARPIKSPAPAKISDVTTDSHRTEFPVTPSNCGWAISKLDEGLRHTKYSKTSQKTNGQTTTATAGSQYFLKESNMKVVAMPTTGEIIPPLSPIRLKSVLNGPISLNGSVSMRLCREPHRLTDGSKRANSKVNQKEDFVPQGKQSNV